jgi:hypothetical protein
MKYSLKKICNFKNIFWILLILLVLIVAYNIIVYFNLYESIVILNDNVTNPKTTQIKYIKIEPQYSSNGSYLQLTEISLYDINGVKVTYSASSSNGSYDSWYYNVNRLNDNNPNTMFIGQPNCTLTITVPDNNIVNKIVIKNRYDGGTLDRLKSYKLSFLNNKNTSFYTINLDDIQLQDLYTYPYTDTIAITLAGKDGINGVQGPQGLPGKDGINGVQGPQGPTGPTATVPVDNSYSGSVQTSETTSVTTAAAK